MKYKKVSAHQNGPRLVVIAGVHGDEYEPMLAAMGLVEKLPEILLKGEVVIVPIANYGAYDNQTRCGKDGLDLARTCPGKQDGSATEKVAFELSEIIKTADYLVDLHTGGVMYDISPLAGYMLHSSEEVLNEHRNMALAFGLPIVWGTEPGPEGRTLSIARDANIPAIYVEYGGGVNVRPQVTEAYQDGVLNILRYLKMIDGEVESKVVEDRYWVEDYREASGFLQGKMPSPVSGIFVKNVNIGEQVKEGQKWGDIVDPMTGSVTPVYVDCDGLAFLIRNLVKVNIGDSLGGVLPIEKAGKKVIYE